MKAAAHYFEMIAKDHDPKQVLEQLAHHIQVGWQEFAFITNPYFAQILADLEIARIMIQSKG